ncbi:uncharacterized protein [Physcomitrium patens]|uniref:uncharacterized protein n=1 Tax=Physcomitrium patens TaxID=3218 RepID=UPI000D16F6EC|nr:uncharacterized protein LOC112283020 isoform X2 [Physcomitrium patens]|eukprot:XP_024377091.1 uncharacterized protein LOC112283020 isoform X2 [Physcomitrella patens]
MRNFKQWKQLSVLHFSRLWNHLSKYTPRKGSRGVLFLFSLKNSSIRRSVDAKMQTTIIPNVGAVCVKQEIDEKQIAFTHGRSDRRL